MSDQTKYLLRMNFPGLPQFSEPELTRKEIVKGVIFLLLILVAAPAAVLVGMKWMGVWGAAK